MPKVDTPAEVRCQLGELEGIRDYGFELVHDVLGQQRNWLHAVSCAYGAEDTREELRARGYHYSHGFANGRFRGVVYTREYPLWVGLYDPMTGERVPVSGGDANARGDTVYLGTVRVVAPSSSGDGEGKGP